MKSNTYIGKWCPKHRSRIRHRNTRNCHECYKEYKRGWGKRRPPRNKERHLWYSRLRRQRIERQCPPWADRSKIDAIYRKRKPGQHVDHIVPLKGIHPETGEHIVCGLHVHYNLRVSSGKANDAKWAYWSPI